MSPQPSKPPAQPQPPPSPSELSSEQLERLANELRPRAADSAEDDG